MDQKLYDLCDWAEIEAIVYSEHRTPHQILGPHVTESGVLIHAFFPTAVRMKVKQTETNQITEMEKVDEAGFFSVLLERENIPAYTYLVTYDNEVTQEMIDPYAFLPEWSQVEKELFAAGKDKKIYEKLGAHCVEQDGVQGVLFAVFAPNAMRVSVVGDFNFWDGRRHQMSLIGESGVFSLFIPGLSEKTLYKYEIKTRPDQLLLKADPYANYAELRPASASIVWNIKKYQWQDQAWLKKRKQMKWEQEPMLIYEVHLGSWKRPDDGREFYTYRELAPMLIEYVKEMGYTHLEFMPIMEYPYDASWGYQVTGYYAPTSRYGTPEDFMYLIDQCHQNGIGVILDWVPAHFPKDAFGLAQFDGTCLYEHFDPRQGYHPHWKTLIYNYGSPYVSNFLLANVLFWLEQYHMDGIRMDAVASMLYLDYGKQDGEWVANKNGGNENLEAIALLREIREAVEKRKDGTLLIAEESTAWPKVTGELKEGSLGFHLKWNMGFMNDFLAYLKCDPLFRKGAHHLITFSMMYAYSEKFLLVFSHDEVVHEKGSMIQKMPGTWEQKFANLRVCYGYWMTHPGKKLLFMGQEFAQIEEWDEKRALHWDELEQEPHQQLHQYMKALYQFYKTHKALYQLDYEQAGFEWINCQDKDRSILVFLRKTKLQEETLVVVCNFTPVVYEEYEIGVPFPGRYKEVFNSDKTMFGGAGNQNSRIKSARLKPMHDRQQSITITVPPLGICIFSFEKPKPKSKKGTTTKAGKTTQKKEICKKERNNRLSKKKKQSTKGMQKGFTK